jgi:SAM-dependent methyltransferase
MEDECGLPSDYFDLVYSVYRIGWTTSLDKTFKRIHSYLKKDGVFVFGWSHPIHKCVSVEDGKLAFSNSYFNEEWYCGDISDKEKARASDNDFGRKALMLPTVFAIKVRKL